MGFFDILKGSGIPDPDEERRIAIAERNARISARAAERSGRTAERDMLRAGYSREEIADINAPKPGLWTKVFGTMDAVGGLPAINATIANVANEARGVEAEKHDPLAGIGAAVQGKDYVTGTEMWQAVGVENEAAAVVLGIISDIALDWTTYATGGMAAASKIGKADEVAEIAKAGVNLASLADLGMDTAGIGRRYGPDVLKMLDDGVGSVSSGAARTIEALPPQLTQEIASAAGRKAGAALEGTQRVANLPFLRKSGEGGIGGIGGIRPGLRTIDPVETAMRQAGGDKTLLGKFADATGKAPTIKSWGSQGDRIAVPLGTRGADKGGFKMFGKTVLDVQPTIDKAAYGTKQMLRDVPAFQRVEGLFNPLADVAKGGNELSTALAKKMLRGQNLARNVGKHVAITQGLELAHAADERELHLMGLGLGEVFDGQKVDYNNLKVFLTEQGVEPARADELVDLMLKRLDWDEARRAEKIGRGLETGEKLGEGSGSAGYTLGTNPEYPGFFEENFGIKSKRTRLREGVQAEVLGEDMPFDLRRTEPEQVGVTRSGGPQQSKPATFKDAQERLRAGFETQTDVSLSHAKAVEKDYANIAKVDFQDQMVDAVGRKIDPDMKPSVGHTKFNIIRNGETITYEVPERFAKWSDSIDKMFMGDESTNSMLRSFDHIMNTWKRMATSWNAGFHGRNAMSNYWLAWTQDLADVKGWEQAPEMFAAAKGNPGKVFTIGDESLTAGEWLQRALEDGVLKGQFGPGEIMEATSRQVSRAGGARTPWDAIEKAGGDLGTAIEDGSRLACYINALDKGMSREVASGLVDRTLYNYSAEAMTPFERYGAKRLIPFYSWMRQNIPSMVAFALKQPGKARIPDKIRRNLMAYTGIESEDLPEWMQGTAIPLPIGEEGVMWNPGLPLQDLEKLDFTKPGETGRGWLSSMAPLPLRLPAELASGTDFFTGKSLRGGFEGDDTRAPGYLQLIGDVVGEGNIPGTEARINQYTGEKYVGMDPYVAKIVREASPWLSKIASAMDVDRSSETWELNLLRYLLGINASQYDEEELQRMAQSGRLNAMQDALRLDQERSLEMRRR